MASTDAENIHQSFLYDRFQRKTRSSRERLYGFGLGFGDLPRIHARDASAVQVHVHHDPVGFRRRPLEHRLQHLDHERHRRVVVVQQHHLELGGLLLLRGLAFLDSGVGAFARIGHDHRVAQDGHI